MRKSACKFGLLIVAIAVASPAMAQGTALHKYLRLADAHSEACVYNYNQCMNGCGGASGCEGQCQANYDGCMSQNQ
jgi:hypothetical protein